MTLKTPMNMNNEDNRGPRSEAKGSQMNWSMIVRVPTYEV